MGEEPNAAPDGLTPEKKEDLNAYYGRVVGSYMRLNFPYDSLLDIAVKNGADRDNVLEIARGGPTDNAGT